MKDIISIMDVLERHRDQLKSLGVARIGVFGSAARGEFGPDSDLDFVVHFNKKSFDSYMDVKLFLEDIFGRKVDLVLEESVKPRLKPVIKRETVYAEGY